MGCDCRYVNKSQLIHIKFRVGSNDCGAVRLESNCDFKMITPYQTIRCSVRKTHFPHSLLFLHDVSSNIILKYALNCAVSVGVKTIILIRS